MSDKSLFRTAQVIFDRGINFYTSSNLITKSHIKRKRDIVQKNLALW
ncbi:Uncharacterised protein, partial [Mycoplasma putrefaciens]